jgi:hypothetical protein
MKSIPIRGKHESRGIVLDEFAMSFIDVVDLACKLNWTY